MNKSILIIILVALVGFSCQKENDEKKVTYLVTGFTTPYKVVYTTGDGSTATTQTITPTSIDMKWTYTFYDIPGEIAYIYLQSDENITNSMKSNVSILIDNKTFQKATKYDNTRVVSGDTVNYIKRAGTIPF